MADGDPNKKYRIAQFLATSFNKRIADQFIANAMQSGANALVRWCVRLDPDPTRRCRHVNLVTETHVEGEFEYLFAAFSIFRVVGVSWSPTPQNPATPHEITIRAAHDNSIESEDLPLAPCS